MNAKQLFIPLALIGVCSVETTPASAAVISFSEDPNETAAIVVTTDIVGATIAAGIETASLSLGAVTGPSTLLFRRQMINMGTMTGEGGGGGVSDVLELDSFLSAAGATIGFLATFQSDTETGISPPPGNFPAGVTNLLEDGTLQLLTPRRVLSHITGSGGTCRFGGKRPTRSDRRAAGGTGAVDARAVSGWSSRVRHDRASAHEGVRRQYPPGPKAGQMAAAAIFGLQATESPRKA